MLTCIERANSLMLNSFAMVELFKVSKRLVTQSNRTSYKPHCVDDRGKGCKGGRGDGDKGNASGRGSGAAATAP